MVERLYVLKFKEKTVYVILRIIIRLKCYKRILSLSHNSYFNVKLSRKISWHAFYISLKFDMLGNEKNHGINFTSVQDLRWKQWHYCVETEKWHRQNFRCVGSTLVICGGGGSSFEAWPWNSLFRSAKLMCRLFFL